VGAASVGAASVGAASRRESGRGRSRPSMAFATLGLSCPSRPSHTTLGEYPDAP
jgi:hypothetical protein